MSTPLRPTDIATGTAVPVTWGLVMTALDSGLWFNLVLHHPVSRAGSFRLLLPAFSVIVRDHLLGARLSLRVMLGGGVTAGPGSIKGGIPIQVIQQVSDLTEFWPALWHGPSNRGKRVGSALQSG